MLLVGVLVCRLLYRAASWCAGCYTVLLVGVPVVIPCWCAGCYTVLLLGVPVVIPCWCAGCYTVLLLGVLVGRLSCCAGSWCAGRIIPCWLVVGAVLSFPSRGWLLTVEYGAGHWSWGGASLVGFVGTGAALLVFSFRPVPDKSALLLHLLG